MVIVYYHSTDADCCDPPTHRSLVHSEAQSIMADIKNFLYAWCGKKKVTPDYDIRTAGNKNRQKFTCEVSLVGWHTKYLHAYLQTRAPPCVCQGQSGRIRLHWDGKLDQQEGRPEQRGPRLCQLPGPDWGNQCCRSSIFGGQCCCTPPEKDVVLWESLRHIWTFRSTTTSCSNVQAVVA